MAFDVNQNWDLRRHLILFVLPSFAARQPRFEKVQADNAASKKRRKPSGSKTTAKAKQIADGGTTFEKTRATKAKGTIETKRRAFLLHCFKPWRRFQFCEPRYRSGKTSVPIICRHFGWG